MQHQPPGTQTSAQRPEGGRDRQTEWGLLPQATSGEQVVNVRGRRVEEGLAQTMALFSARCGLDGSHETLCGSKQSTPRSPRCFQSLA